MSARIVSCPLCGDEAPERHITPDGCPSCNDEVYNALMAEIQWADAVRWADAR